MSRSRSHALISDALGEVIAVEVPRVSGGVSQGYDPDLAAFHRGYVRTVSYTCVMSPTASWQSRCEVAWACVRRSRDAVYLSLSRFATGTHAGAAPGEPGAPPASAADRPCPEQCQALSQRQRPKPPLEGGRLRSGEGPLRCPA